jgi:phage terminase large subunit
MKTTYKHNSFVPEATKKRLEGFKLTNPILYKLWTLGEYTEVQGAIYTNWRNIQKLPEGAEFLGYGLDWGFTGDPAAVLKIWKVGHLRIVIKGIVYQRGLTNPDLADEMKEKKVKSDDKIICDSAEPKSKEEVRREGFRGIRGVKKRPRYKRDVIRVLQGYEILVMEGDINLNREMSTYAWQQDKEGNPLPEPMDGNDHYMDCLSMFWYDYKGTDGIMSVPDEGF